MGTIKPSVAINEAVFLLSQISPGLLESLRGQYPELADELKEGIYAGPESEGTSHLIDKAKVVTVALDEASKKSKEAMAVVSTNIRKARLRRLVSQAFVLVGSSSLMGAITLDKDTAAVISAVFTLLSALGNLFAENYEKLLNPQTGNIYEAFQELGEGTYKARTLSEQIQLAVRYHDPGNTLTELIGKANELCEQLNAWLIQVLNQFPESSLAPQRTPQQLL